MYVSVNGAFRYGITAPFHRPQSDPPPSQPQYNVQGIEDCYHLPQHISPHGGHVGASASRNQIQQRRTSRPHERTAKVVVETLRTCECRRNDESDAQPCDAELSLSAESDSEEPMRSPEEVTEAGAKANRARTQDAAAESDSPQSRIKHVKVNKPKDEAGKVNRASKPPAEEQPSKHVHVRGFSQI